MGQCVQSHRGGEKTPWKTVSCGPNRTDTLTNSQRLWKKQGQDLYKFRPHTIPEQRRGNGTKLSPPTKKLLHLITAGNRKISFLQWGVSGNIKYINHTPGQAACPKAVGQHKMYVVFLFCFPRVFFSF